MNRIDVAGGSLPYERPAGLIVSSSSLFNRKPQKSAVRLQAEKDDAIARGVYHGPKKRRAFGRYLVPVVYGTMARQKMAIKTSRVRKGAVYPKATYGLNRLGYGVASAIASAPARARFVRRH